MGKRANQQQLQEMGRQLAELRQLVTRLKAENGRLRAELAALRGEDVSFAAEEPDPTTPEEPVGRKALPRWLKANVVIKEHHRPRRGRAPVAGWRRHAPDRQVVHAVEACTGCGEPLRRGEVIGRRQVVLLPPVRAEVVEHVVLARRCRRCGMVNRGQMPDLSEAVGEHRRLGWEILAQAAVLRTRLRLPLASLQWLMEHVWGVHLSIGALCGALDDAAQAGQTAYRGLLAQARASPALHIDETGWRQNGRNGFVWTVDTNEVRYFHYSPSRAGYVARRLVGEEYAGVVVSDSYTAYDQLDGLHQRCWAHLLRDIHELRIKDPDDADLAAWAHAVQTLYDRACRWGAPVGIPLPPARDAARRGFEQQVQTLCQQAPGPACRSTLCGSGLRCLNELFMFVGDPAVPSTNNAAERALRPLVVARKISGGTRSETGTRTRMILQSLLATWDLRHEDPMHNMLTLFQNQQMSDSILAAV